MAKKTLDPLQMVSAGVYEGFGFSLTRGVVDRRWYLKRAGELVGNGFQVKGDAQKHVAKLLDKLRPEWKEEIKPKPDRTKEKQAAKDKRAAKKAL